MKSSFFSKLGLGSTSKRSTGPNPEEVAAQFAAAADLLQKIRSGSRPDFPALNEATRLVQLLDGTVSKMPEGETKSISREQVLEMQRELQLATERLLSNGSNQASRSQSQEAGLFQGLEAVGQEVPAEPPAGGVDMGDMFSGLSIADNNLEAEAALPEAPGQAPAPVHEHLKPTGRPNTPPMQSQAAPLGASSGPLPEDLFSGLEELNPSPLSSPPPPDAHPAASPAAVRSSQGRFDLLSSLSDNPPSLPQPGTSPTHTAQASRTQAVSLPGALSADSHAAQPCQAASPEQAAPQEGVRKKKVTRRIGYDRETRDSGTGRVSTVPLTEILPQLTASRSAAGAAAGPLAPDKPRKLAPEPLALPQHTSSPQRAEATPQIPTFDPVPMVSTAAPLVARTAQIQPFDPGAIIEAMPHVEVAAAVAALKAAAETALSHAGRDGEAAAAGERAARAKRRALLSEVAAANESIAQLAAKEAGAVENEDFEEAASLSARLDSTKQQLEATQRALHRAEDECARLAERKALTVQQQADIWRQAAAALSQLQGKHAQDAQQADTDAQKAASQAQESELAAQEHLEELGERIRQRQKWLDDESATVQKKVADAQAPVAAERQARADAHAAVAARVEELRSALAEQEAALDEAESALAESDAAMAAAASRYSKILARLEEDRAALAADVAERDSESAAAAEATAGAARQQHAAVQRQQQHLQQAGEAGEAAAALRQKADALAGSVDAQAQARALQERLRREQSTAEAELQAAQQAFEAAQAVARDTASRAKALVSSAAAAEEQAAAARRRIPGLEADKKAAAAARAFKEAARLAAEAKACASEAESCTQRAAQAREQAATAEQERSTQEAVVASEQGSIARTKHAVALAQWRRLRVQAQESSRALEAALAAEDFEEAAALQAEHDSAVQQAEALAASHGFTPAADLPEQGGVEAGQRQASSAKSSLASADGSPHVPRPDDVASVAAPSTSRFATDGSESVRSVVSMSAYSDIGEPAAAIGPAVAAADLRPLPLPGAGTASLSRRTSTSSRQSNHAMNDASHDTNSLPAAVGTTNSRLLHTPAGDAQDRRESQAAEPGYMADSDSTAYTQPVDLDDAQPPGAYARSHSLSKSNLRASDGAWSAQGEQSGADESAAAHSESSSAEARTPAENGDSHVRLVKFAGVGNAGSLDGPPSIPDTAVHSHGMLPRPSLTGSTMAVKGSPSASDISVRSFQTGSWGPGPDSDTFSQKDSVAAGSAAGSIAAGSLAEGSVSGLSQDVVGVMSAGLSRQDSWSAGLEGAGGHSTRPQQSEGSAADAVGPLLGREQSALSVADANGASVSSQVPVEVSGVVEDENASQQGADGGDMFAGLSFG